jgi:hypothetical protein
MGNAKTDALAIRIVRTALPVRMVAASTKRSIEVCARPAVIQVIVSKAYAFKVLMVALSVRPTVLTRGLVRMVRYALK